MKRWLAAAALATACLGASPARAQTAPSAADVEEASKHYARGVQLYEQGADSAALAELERAYELAPNWKVLYELGVVALALHDFAAALDHFERYLAEGKDGVKGQRRQEVTEKIAQLRTEVATIELVTTAGAEIKLDDVVVGTAPLAKPLVVNPGHHKLGASKDGLAAEGRALSLAGGDLARVELVFPVPAPPPPAPVAPAPEAAPPPAPPVAAPPPPVPVPAPAPEEPPARATPYPLWIGWVGTAALAAGAIATGAEALSANASLTHAKNDGPSTPDTLSSLSSRARSFALASDVMTGAALVTGGVTLYFTLRAPARATTAATSPSASLGLGVGRVALEGTF